MWKYESPIGPLYIKKLPDGRFGLLFKDNLWEASHSPQAEADNVYHHMTGCDEWDLLDGKVLDAPSDLSEWEVI